MKAREVAIGILPFILGLSFMYFLLGTLKEPEVVVEVQGKSTDPLERGQLELTPKGVLIQGDFVVLCDTTSLKPSWFKTTGTDFEPRPFYFINYEEMRKCKAGKPASIKIVGHRRAGVMLQEKG